MIKTAETNVTDEAYPGPADYRRLFPASTVLENIHLLVHPDGTTHLRNPFHRLGHHGPDAAICSNTYRAPDGSTFNLNKKGRAAIAVATCVNCKRAIAPTVLRADDELPAVEREAKALASSARHFRRIEASFTDATTDAEREQVGVQVRGREATLSVLEAFKR